MSEQRHIIQKQVVELTVKGTAQTNPLQDEISRIYRQRIMPLIDECFSELSDPDKLYRIDTLELDIGQIDPDHLEENFIEKVNDALRRALANQIEIHELASEGTKQDTKTGSQLELFEVFARSGSLPWWADASRPQLLDENLDFLLDESPLELRTSLQVLLQETRSRTRIVNHYTDEQLAQIVGLFAPAYRSNIARYHPNLIRILKKTKAGSSRPASFLRKSLWNHLLHVVSIGGSKYSTEMDFYQAAIQRLTRELGGTSNSLIVEMQEVLKNNKANIDHSTQEKLAQLLKADELSRSEQASRKDEARQKKMDEQSALEEPAQVKEEQPIHLSSERNKDPFEEIDKLYIGNAGLVILWPFLENFFIHVNLLENKQFNDRAAQHRAVELLQRLVLPDAESPEYLLPLNKILCGMELEEVLDVNEPLLDFEIEECEHLLEAAIAQAPILNDMSTDGFRGTFLLRSGILSLRDGLWLLQVERETYDIVLERFPWSWEWVKLPWMDSPLRVEW